MPTGTSAGELRPSQLALQAGVDEQVADLDLGREAAELGAHGAVAVEAALARQGEQVVEHQPQPGGARADPGALGAEALHRHAPAVAERAEQGVRPAAGSRRRRPR